MLSRGSVPRIRVDIPDNSLSPSNTLDIKDILGPAKLLPRLLVEDLAFGLADDDLYSDDGYPMQHVPSFPTERRPPLFILNSHRAGLLFPIRSNAFELGDFCRDEEDACPLLTAPTVPRMKMMIQERLYVRKWVDKLSPDSPPKHIPWTCEKPPTKKDWIAEGSILPAEKVKLDKFCAEQRGTSQGHSCITDAKALVNQAPLSRRLYSGLEVSIPANPFTESHTPTPHVYIKSADVDPGILRGESKASHAPRRIVRTPRAPPPPVFCRSGSPLRTISNTPDVPLAARRGKSLSGLKLNECVIEHLEYPDIPTAFRGCPIDWSPRFDTLPVSSFTDHDSMLLDLKSKCVALGNGVSAYIQEPLSPLTEPSGTSPSVDEWAFTSGLATFNSDFLGSTGRQVSKETVIDTSTFPLGDSSTGSTAYVDVVTRLHSTPALQLPKDSFSDPPRVPLPPRPALMNPSTPPHVRGILKKTKSVRFEDVAITELENGPQASLEHASPSSLAVPSERLCTPISNPIKPSGSPAPVKGAHGMNVQRKSGSRSRLPPKRTKASEGLQPARLNVSDAAEIEVSIEPLSPTTSVGGLTRAVRVEENTDPAAPQERRKASTVPEIDIRKGIEGTTKSRLSVPLRNIFRFR